MKQKKKIKIISAILTMVAVLLGGWGLMKPGGLFAEESDLQPNRPGTETKIAVQVSAPDLVQTYKNPTTGSTASNLPLTLKVNMSQAGIEGSSVKIPLQGFIPDGQTGDGQPYAGFTMTEPIYDIYPANLAAIQEHSMVKEANVEGTDLVISFNQTKKTTFTLNLTFQFNDAYLGKIPPTHCVWNEAQAFVFADNSTSPDAISNKVTVKTDVPDENRLISFSYTSESPASQVYSSGNILTWVQLNLLESYRWVLESGTEYTVYIDVPKGFGVQTQTQGQGSLGQFEPDSSYNNTHPNTDRYQVKFGDIAVVKSSYVTVIPPADLTMSTFTTSMGISYTGVNAPMINRVLKELNFTNGSGFSLYLPNSIYYPDGGLYGQRVFVDTSDPAMVSRKFIFSRPGTTAHTIMNEGIVDVKGVRLVISQPKVGSEKLNFNSVKNAATTPVRAKCVIKDASQPNDQGITQEIGVVQKDALVPLPILDPGKYIDQIIFIPTNEEGTADGVLPPKGRIHFYIDAKNWPNNNWPDGTPISSTNASVVTMGGSIDYLDEANNEKTKAFDPYEVFYVPKNAILARAALGTSSVGTEAGGLVSYALTSSLWGGNTLGNWVNPVVYIAVPKEMALVGSDKKVLEVGETITDVQTVLSNVASSSGTEALSTITRLSPADADAAYHYYSIATTATIEPSSREVSQKWMQVSQTNLEFKVSASAKKGTYPIPVILATNKNAVDSNENNLFVQSVPTYEPMGNIANILKDNSTLLATMQNILGANQNYTAFGASEATPLKVLEGGGIDETTTFQTGEEVFWNNPTTGGTTVNSGTSVRLKSEFGNSSKENTYDNIRLYYLLPDANDLAFKGLNADWLEELPAAQKEGLEVYYTTAPIADLIPYEAAEVKDWYAGADSDGDLGVLTGMGFTEWEDLTSLPTVDPITGLYVTYAQQGTDSILPAGEMLDTVLDFEVPGKTSAPYNSVANLTYKYAVKSVDDGDVITNMSDTVQINTQTVIHLTYDANLPEGVTDSPTDMPKDPDPIEVDADGKATYEIPKPAPSLADYTFEGWQLKIGDTVVEDAEGNPIVYTSGEELELDAANGLEVTLQAVWQPILSISVSAPNLYFEETSVPLKKGQEFINRKGNQTTVDGQGWSITVTAPEVEDKEYAVTAKIQTDFTDEADASAMIPNLLIFKANANDDESVIPVDGKGQPITLFTGEGPQTKVWQADEGFLLDLSFVDALNVASKLRANALDKATYTATIEVSLDYVP